MGYERFIAKRYLLSKHKINFISIISFISITGITIGVAALIVVLSVFNGFGSLVTSFLMNFDPHLRVEYKIDTKAKNAEELNSLIKQLPDLKSYAPFVSGKVLVVSNQQTQVINLKGIDTASTEKVYNIKENIIYGNDDLVGVDGQAGVIIGLRLADELRTLVGDTITVISPEGIERVVSQFGMPNSAKFIVRGIFSSQNNEYDESLMFVPLEDAQYLLGYDVDIQGYDIKLNNSDNSFNAKDFLESKLDANTFEVNTWYDFHKELYSVMQIERWVAYILLSLIIAVATFNILGSLSMSVIEKKRDIGIMRSMGSQEKSILKIFMYEGLMIGVVGTLLGVILGYFICFLQLQYNIYPLDPTQYKIDSLPLEIRLSDFFYIAGVSLFLSLIASYIPAKRAAKVDALQAIKWE
ncbi:MAG: ABC transporter permease [Ignavibacteriales bacterium]|nr:ABC transporter permease [Ignavibacteriales bacterium]